MRPTGTLMFVSPSFESTWLTVMPAAVSFSLSSVTRSSSGSPPDNWISATPEMTDNRFASVSSA